MLDILLDWFGGALVTVPLVVIYLLLQDKQRFTRKWFWAVLLTLYLSALFIIVGIPGFSYFRWDPSFNWIPFQDTSSSNLWGMGMNALLFLPFGALTALYFRQYRSLGENLLAGICLSVLIEFFQMFGSRATDVDDLIMNALGTVLGWYMGAILAALGKDHSPRSHDASHLITIVCIVLLCTIFVRYPLVAYLLKVLK